MNDFPVGPEVSTTPARRPDQSETLVGRFVRIERPDPDGDANALFEATHSGDADVGQWTYMSFGPFDDPADLASWARSAASSGDPLFMTVRDVSSREPVGMVSFLNIQEQHRTIELGNIWFVPKVRRSSITTEAIYLLLQHCFDSLGYRRVEWKCDSLNARSCAAAERLGFTFEGVFRSHYIVKGRSRDTAWYAMLDTDWSRISEEFRTFLYDPDCRQSLRALIDTR